VLILIDGEPGACVPADDRGLAYGDGVFRTLTLRGGRPLLWSRHYAKLAADCRALAIVPPEERELRADLGRVAAAHPDCVLRITVTRGSGGRGYQPPPQARPRRIVAASAPPEFPAAWPREGVTVRHCAIRLAAQPRLAGVKHLNRLENVLARAEWTDPRIAEGLLSDAGGRVIEGCRSNLFIVEQGRLLTPGLSDCGVSGVTREAILEAGAGHGFDCRIEGIGRDRLEAAEAVLLVNSLIGVWPVARLGARRWQNFAVAGRLREWLDELVAAAR
jgi:4-amino-4-deoxychorismate lyase